MKSRFSGGKKLQCVKKIKGDMFYHPQIRISLFNSETEIPVPNNSELQLNNQNEFHNEQDYYTILGIERNATEREIKLAYYKLALKYHPDKNKNPYAVIFFHKIQNAYDTLSDSNLRSLYDQKLQSSSLRSYSSTFIETALLFLDCSNSELLCWLTLSYIFSLGLDAAIDDFFTHNLDSPGNFINTRFSEQSAPAPTEIVYNNFSASWHDFSIHPNPIQPYSFFNPAPLLITLPSKSLNQARLDYYQIEEDIPEEYICALSSEVMTRPVNNEAKGLPNVEKDWILIEIQRTGLNPFNKQPLSENDLIPNLKLKTKIANFVEKIISNFNSETIIREGRDEKEAPSLQL